MTVMNPLRTGQRITAIGCNDMAMTWRREFTVQQVRPEPTPCGYENRMVHYGNVVQRRKRKAEAFAIKPDSTIVLDGWDLPILADTDQRSFRGNALLNLIGEEAVIKALIDSAIVVSDNAKALCVVWGSTVVNNRTPGVTCYSPSEEFTILYRELAKMRRHAVMERMLKESEPACNCEREVPTGQPFPNYCAEHDGDYSQWLVSNNID